MPSTINLFFDWTTLTFAGAMVLICGIYNFFKVMMAREHMIRKLQCPTCGQLFDEDLGKQGTECPYCHTSGTIGLEDFDIKAARKMSMPAI